MATYEMNPLMESACRAPSRDCAEKGASQTRQAIYFTAPLIGAQRLARVS